MSRKIDPRLRVLLLKISRLPEPEQSLVLDFMFAFARPTQDGISSALSYIAFHRPDVLDQAADAFSDRLERVESAKEASSHVGEH